MPGFDPGPHTAAEVYQIWTEHMRYQWNHTAMIAGHIRASTGSKKDKIRLEDLNPMEEGGTTKQGIPLNSVEGFQALKSATESWRSR